MKYVLIEGAIDKNVIFTRADAIDFKIRGAKKFPRPIFYYKFSISSTGMKTFCSVVGMPFPLYGRRFERTIPLG